MSDNKQQSPAQADAVYRESPLHYVLKESQKNQVSFSEQRLSDYGVVFCEHAFKGHLNLRGNPNNELFCKAVEECLGVSLPIEPGAWSGSGQTTIYWLGPTEWLVIVAPDTQQHVEQRLRELLHGHFSIVDISGGQTLINLSGDQVPLLLKKSCVYDFQSDKFGVGKCVQTTFAKAGALIARNADGSLDLVLRRSFADYLFRWISDASVEYGFIAVSGSCRDAVQPAA